MASAQRLLLIGLVKNPFKLKSNRDFFFTYLEKQFEPFRGSTMSSCFLRSVTWGNWDNFLSQTRSTVLEQQPDSRGLGGRWSLPSWKQLVRTCHSDIIRWQLWFEYENHSWTVSSVLRCSQPLEPNTDKYTSTQPFDVTKADWYLQLCPGSIGHVDNAGWAFWVFFFLVFHQVFAVALLRRTDGNAWSVGCRLIPVLPQHMSGVSLMTLHMVHALTHTQVNVDPRKCAYTHIHIYTCCYLLKPYEYLLPFHRNKS